MNGQKYFQSKQRTLQFLNVSICENQKRKLSKFNHKSSMRSQSSKLQNRSTSSSDFFAKKYPSNYNNHHQPYEHGISSYISSGFGQQSSSIVQKSSKIIKQSSKVVNEYQMFQPSKLMNQNESHLKSQVKQTTYEPKNPFLSHNYDLVSKNKQDGISENKLSKNTFGSSCKFVKFQTEEINNKRTSEYQPYLQKYDNSQGFHQFTQQKRSYSSHKQNIQPGLTSNHKTFDNSELLRPITLVRASSDKNILPVMGISRFQETSIIDEPHRMLDHIYFTIAHESDLRKVFKQFAAHQQQKINQRFREIVMSLENTFNEIKIIFDKKIDHTYQTLLSQLDSLKSMAQIMWKNKRNKTFSSHQMKEIPRVQRYQRVSSKSRERPQSKHTYMKFSQLEVRSAQSNNLLLNQLIDEDKMMGEYKTTKRFYENESESGNQIDRDKLLRDMYEVSTSIAKMMRPCENGLLDEVLEDKREKKKGLVWFSEASNENRWKELYDNPLNMGIENIGEVMSKEWYELDSFVEGFRASLRHKYKDI